VFSKEIGNPYKESFPNILHLWRMIKWTKNMQRRIENHVIYCYLKMVGFNTCVAIYMYLNLVLMFYKWGRSGWYHVLQSTDKKVWIQQLNNRFKSGKWAVTYMCVWDIEFPYFEYSIGVWNCSYNVACFLFILSFVIDVIYLEKTPYMDFQLSLNYPFGTFIIFLM
jgi:hypothetical protein